MPVCGKKECGFIIRLSFQLFICVNTHTFVYIVHMKSGATTTTVVSSSAQRVPSPLVGLGRAVGENTHTCT